MLMLVINVLKSLVLGPYWMLYGFLQPFMIPVNIAVEVILPTPPLCDILREPKHWQLLRKVIFLPVGIILYSSACGLLTSII